MSQAPLFVAIFLVGLAVALALGPRDRIALACALAFPTGLVVVVLGLLTLLVLDVVPYGRSSAAVVALIPTVGAAIVVARRGLPPGAALRLVLATVAFALGAAALSYANLSLMSFDSHQFVKLGRIIGDDHRLAEDVFGELQFWGVFQVVAHAMTALTRQDYLYALQPVLALSFLPMFVLLLWDGVTALGAEGRRAQRLVALVTVALFTVYMFHRNFLYIHTNFPSAVFLFGYAMLAWRAEVRREPEGLPLAFLFLVGFSLQRVEAPLFALIFLVLTVPTSALPRPELTRPLVGFTILVAGWFEVLAHHVPSDGAFLTPLRCRAFGGIIVAFLAYHLVSDRGWLRRISPHLPRIMGATLLLALAAAFALKPAHMLESADHWSSNLLRLPYWGQTWYLIAVLVVVGMALPAPPSPRVFTYGVSLTLILIMLLAVGRIPYRFTVSDSANRMTIHILPLLFAYLGLKLIPGFPGVRRAGSP